MASLSQRIKKQADAEAAAVAASSSSPTVPTAAQIQKWIQEEVSIMEERMLQFIQHELRSQRTMLVTSDEETHWEDLMPPPPATSPVGAVRALVRPSTPSSRRPLMGNWTRE